MVGSGRLDSHGVLGYNVVVVTLDTEVTMMTEILKESLAAAKAEVLRLTKELHESQLKDSGLVIGETVVQAENGKKYLLAVCEFSSWRKKPYVQGYPIKPDGTVTKQLRNIYSDWEIVK